MKHHETIDSIVLDHVARAVTTRDLTFHDASGIVTTWDQLLSDAARGRFWRGFRDGVSLGPIRRAIAARWRRWRA